VVSWVVAIDDVALEFDGGKAGIPKAMIEVFL
jgi:hypothetical protein